MRRARDTRVFTAKMVHTGSAARRHRLDARKLF